MSRMWLAAALLFASMAGSTRAEDKPLPEPTPEQLAEVKAAVEKLGGRFVGPAGPADERYSQIYLNQKATDADLKKLPNIPFAFYLSLGPKLTEDALKELKRFPSLVGLSLRGRNWTGKRWKELAGLDRLTVLEVESAFDLGDVDWKPLRRLRELSLDSTKATGAGLNELPELRELTLYQSAVTEAGLRDVGQLKHLTRLSLHGTAVTDAWLKGLAGLESLAELNLEFTPVTGSGFKDLGKLKKLNKLLLAHSGVTDEGLKGVKALTGLTDLQLMHTKVTNAGVGELAAITGLKSLGLEKTAVTRAGVWGLQKALPGCAIHLDPLAR